MKLYVGVILLLVVASVGGRDMRRTTTTEVRLINGPTPWEGRVEVYHDGQWGTVCDDEFGLHDARAVCSQVGYHGGEVASGYGEGTGPIFLDQLRCPDHSTSLDDCSHLGWGVHDCSHSEDVGVWCSERPLHEINSVEGGVRLVYGEETDNMLVGRLEIYHEGEWGTVCDDWFEEYDAAVVCNQLGFTDAKVVPSGWYPAGGGTIWMDDVACGAGHYRLADCGHAGWGSTDCVHEEDVAVQCDGRV